MSSDEFRDESYLISENIGFLKPNQNPDTNSAKAYRFSLRSELDAREAPFLREDLVSSLLQPDTVTMFDYSYFETTGTQLDQELNTTYAVLTNNIQLQPGEYGNTDMTILVEALDETVVMSLKDEKYCQTDADCMIRENNFCKTGAYNQYKPVILSGACPPPSYEGVASSKLESWSCDVNKVQVSYATVECVANQCQGVEPQLSCLE